MNKPYKNPIPDGNGDDSVNKYTKNSIPGITDKLFEKGFYIESIEAAPDTPQGAKVLKLNQLNELLNSGAGIIALNGKLKSVKGLNQIGDRIARTKIGQLIDMKIDHDIRQSFLKPENNYLIIEIDR